MATTTRSQISKAGALLDAATGWENTHGCDPIVGRILQATIILLAVVEEQERAIEFLREGDRKV